MLRKESAKKTFRITLKKAGCIVLEQAVDEVIDQGIYMLISSNSIPYVGMTSRDFKTRLKEHSKKIGDVFEKINVAFDKSDFTSAKLRYAEQYVFERLLESFGMKVDDFKKNNTGKVLNRRNPGGEKARDFVKNNFKMCKN